MSDPIIIVAIGVTVISILWLGFPLWLTSRADMEWEARRREFEADAQHCRLQVLCGYTLEELLDQTIEPHRQLARIEAEIQSRFGVAAGERNDLADAISAAVYDGRGWKELRSRAGEKQRVAR